MEELCLLAQSGSLAHELMDMVVVYFSVAGIYTMTKSNLGGEGRVAVHY